MSSTIRRFLFTGAVLIAFITQSFSQVERVEKGNLVIEGIPEIPQTVITRMQQYQNVRSASMRGWLADGSGMLISTRFGETRQIHRVDQPLGTRQQLTFFDEPVGSATIRPSSTSPMFLFTKDVGGGEFYQIFSFDMSNGEYKLLSDGKSRYGGMLWSNAGDRFAYFSTERNGRDWDVMLATPDNPAGASTIVNEGGVWYPLDWSKDDQQLLVGKYISANESYVYTLDFRNNALQQVHESAEKISYGSGLWNKDASGIYLTSDEDSEFQRLRFYDIASGKFSVITPNIPWNVTNLEMSPDGESLAFTTNENGLDVLYLLNTDNNTFRKVNGLPIGLIYGIDFHPDNQQLALVFNTSETPGDVFVLDTASDKLTRWTKSEVGGLDTGQMIAPTVIHYPTFDKVDGKPRQVPALYYKPKTGSAPYPVVIKIHGGPEGQFRPYFSSTTQYYLNEMGIAVVAPNVRGSDGYGKSYLKLDNGYKREDSVKDIGKLLDWIAAQPELDASRVMVMGGSYGGYMVLASMIHYNDRLAGGIDVVGISNFVTFLENTKEYRRDLRRAEYGDERDEKMRAFLEKISPTTNAHKINKPLFIAQGLNDPRVPASEAEQMLEAIRKNGGEAWYMLAKDEGHGFAKKSNSDFYNQAVVLFLEKILLAGKPSS